MKALREQMDPAEAAVRSLNAGADMILISASPSERERILDTLVRAYEPGRIAKSQVRASVRRVLRLKLSLLLHL